MTATKFDPSTPPTPAALAAAGALIVRDEDNNDVSLGSLWADQKTIVIFIRHFVRVSSCTLPLFRVHGVASVDPLARLDYSSAASVRTTSATSGPKSPQRCSRRRE